MWTPMINGTPFLFCTLWAQPTQRTVHSSTYKQPQLACLACNLHSKPSMSGKSKPNSNSALVLPCSALVPSTSVYTWQVQNKLIKRMVPCKTFLALNNAPPSQRSNRAAKGQQHTPSGCCQPVAPVPFGRPGSCRAFWKAFEATIVHWWQWTFWQTHVFALHKQSLKRQ